MLPADIIAEITTNLAALHLESNTAAQILAAVFAPLLRTGPNPGSSGSQAPAEARAAAGEESATAEETQAPRPEARGSTRARPRRAPR